FVVRLTEHGGPLHLDVPPAYAVTAPVEPVESLPRARTPPRIRPSTQKGRRALAAHGGLSASDAGSQLSAGADRHPRQTRPGNDRSTDRSGRSRRRLALAVERRPDRA